MTLGSTIEDGKKVYILKMTEEEFIQAQKGETVKRIVQWSQGQGAWSVAFKKYTRKGNLDSIISLDLIPKL